VLIPAGAIAAGDLELVTLTDDPEEVVRAMGPPALSRRS
jgi:hypothetical protein